MNYSSVALPISFTFYRLPIEWRVPEKKEAVRNGVPDFWFRGRLLDKPISHLDSEAARRSFLRLQAYIDEDGEFVEPDFLKPVAEFLNSVGSFMDDSTFHPGLSKTFDLPRTDESSLIRAVVPRLRLQSRTISGFLYRLRESMLHTFSFSHILTVGLRGPRQKPIPYVETASFWDAALAITMVDHIRKARMRACAECGAPFALHTKHAKKFCTWNCAHRATVRKSRLKKEKNK